MPSGQSLPGLNMIRNLRYIKVPTLLVLLFFLSATAFAGGAIYWIVKKDNEVEKFRRIEIDLQNQIHDRDLRLQQEKQKIEQLKRRVEIFDAIEELSSATLSEKDKWMIAKVVDEESQKYNHDPFLILALIDTESSIRPAVVSHKGAEGLMQIMPHTGRALSNEIVKNPKLLGLKEGESSERLSAKEIEGNIKLGTLYLTQLLLKYKNLEDAFMAYNMGPTRLDQYKKEGTPFSKRYATKIFTKYKQLQESRNAPRTALPKIYATEADNIFIAQK
jgi:soluble lytic murein transglycosylase